MLARECVILSLYACMPVNIVHFVYICKPVQLSKVIYLLLLACLKSRSSTLKAAAVHSDQTNHLSAIYLLISNLFTLSTFTFTYSLYNSTQRE